MERQLAAAFGELEEIGRHLTEVAADGRAALQEDRAAPLRATVDRAALRRMADSAASGEAPMIVGNVARVLSQVSDVAASMAVRALWYWHQRLDLPFGAPLTRKRLGALLDAPIRVGIDASAFVEAELCRGIVHSQDAALVAIALGLTSVARGAAVLEKSQLDTGMQESADLCPARDNEGADEAPKRKRRPVDFGPHQAAVNALAAACPANSVEVVALLKRLGVIKRVPPASPAAAEGSPGRASMAKAAEVPTPLPRGEADATDVAATVAVGDGMAAPDASPVGRGTRPSLKQGTPLHARRASFSKALNSMPSLPSHARARPVPRAPPITERVQARDPVADARALLEAPPGTFLAVDLADPVTRLELLSSDLRRGARYADEQLVEVRRTAKSAIDGVRQLSSLASTLRALEELAATEAIACDAELATFGAARRALELAACLVVGGHGCLTAPDHL